MSLFDEMFGEMLKTAKKNLKIVEETKIKLIKAYSSCISEMDSVLKTIKVKETTVDFSNYVDDWNSLKSQLLSYAKGLAEYEEEFASKYNVDLQVVRKKLENLVDTLDKLFTKSKVSSVEVLDSIKNLATFAKDLNNLHKKISEIEKSTGNSFAALDHILNSITLSVIYTIKALASVVNAEKLTSVIKKYV